MIATSRTSRLIVVAVVSQQVFDCSSRRQLRSSSTNKSIEQHESLIATSSAKVVITQQVVREAQVFDSNIKNELFDSLATKRSYKANELFDSIDRPTNELFAVSQHVDRAASDKLVELQSLIATSSSRVFNRRDLTVQVVR